MWKRAAILATKRSAGVAPEVNLGECIKHMPLPNMNNTQGRCHQKSKTPQKVSLKRYINKTMGMNIV